MDLDYIACRNKALQQYEGAYHLLNVTFPMIRDPKLLLGVINNLFLSLEYGMEAVLVYERQLKLIPPYWDNFQSKFNTFRHKSAQRNKINPQLFELILTLKEMLDLHKKSPMEFQRGNRFVICTKDYQMKIISLKEIKEYTQLTKDFLDRVDQTIKLNRK